MAWMPLFCYNRKSNRVTFPRGLEYEKKDYYVMRYLA